MSGWHDVSDQQLDLYRFWRSSVGRKAAEGFGESMVQVEREVHGDGAIDKLASHIAEAEASKMFHADPIYVDDDMMTLIEAAAESFQPEALQESDFITSSGFVVFPRPLFMQDRHNRRVSFRALSWMPLVITNRGTGVHLSMYSHVDDMFGGADDYGPDGTQFEGMTAADLTALLGAQFMLAHLTGWQYGEDIPQSHIELGATWWRPVQAFLRLTLQTVGERYQQQPPRAARKRWQKEGKPKEDRYITVIRLRRPRGHRSDEATSVEWQQRWVVTGHWRNQWFPSLSTHRQIWIGSYVKGPDDKPLLVRKGRAFELVR